MGLRCGPFSPVGPEFESRRKGSLSIVHNGNLATRLIDAGQSICFDGLLNEAAFIRTKQADFVSGAPSDYPSLATGRALKNDVETIWRMAD